MSGVGGSNAVLNFQFHTAIVIGHDQVETMHLDAWLMVQNGRFHRVFNQGPHSRVEWLEQIFLEVRQI